MLLFRVGQERYALDTTSVVEVIPKVDLLPYHGTQPIVAGRFNYQGQIVPVLDLSQFLGDKPCPSVLSSRIIIVAIARPDRYHKRLLGLLVEKATETLSGDRVDLAEDSIKLAQRPYLGDVVLQDRAMIQCLHPDRLLSEQSYNNLVTPPEITEIETGEAIG